MNFYKNRTMFRCSAFRFHGFELINPVNFCNFFTFHARELVDGSNESETPSSYPTNRGTICVSALVFELLLKTYFEKLT